MAERMIKRRGSRLTRSASAESAESTYDTPAMGKSIKRKNKKPKERWLLTRKTWRYMTDAGRKLIPDGVQNRPEDIPKIEAYFQEVCKREAKFLLWRKNSYPGALNFRKKRRERLKGGSCRKACSSDEVDIKPERPKDLSITSVSGGRFDIQKMKHDFLNKPSPSSPRSFSKTFPTTPEYDSEEQEEKQLVSMLEIYLRNTASPATKTDLNYQELIDKLQRHLTLSTREIPTKTTSPTNRVYFDGDHMQKSLSETLSRYFSQYPNRDRVISDLLTDRKILENLYFELRKAKGFRGRVNERYSGQNQPWSTSLLRKYGGTDADHDIKTVHPPLIEIQDATVDITYKTSGIQTLAIPESELVKIDEEYKKVIAERDEDMRETQRHGYRRRSSVDNDDVSQSVSDTIKRYLRMARKKSVDSDKVDRFKRVNYDRNLRNIKAKGEITKPGDDDGLNKGCQTNDEWILIYRDLKFDEIDSYEPESRVSSSRNSIDVGVLEERSSPTSLISSGQSFLSHLLHGKHGHDKTDRSASAAASATGTMQKSKSSSSVHGKQRLAKKIFKSRSKSQTRPSVTTSNWTPQGSCIWNSVTGRQVLLTDTTLLQLSEVERKVLQKVALAKLQALNLGVTVKLPSDNVGSVVSKPKRRPYLLKRKALTTGIFDMNRKDTEKEGSTSGGLVFGIPLSQCVENDRLSRMPTAASPFRSRGELSGSGDEPTTIGRHGSRASFSSLIDATRAEERGSCESLMGRERIVGSVPGLLDALSCGSTADIATATAEEEPAVPNILHVCFRHLEAHGLHTLGIFRVSTSKKRIRQLREDFDCGKENTLDDEQCPHDVATLIKEYLRELPDPLLCRDLYHPFVQTQRIRNRRLQFEALQHLIQLLPSAHRDTLYALLNFLTSVAKFSNDYRNTAGEDVCGNKMDSNNLATVFAPNILHCIKPGSKDNSGDRPEDRIDVINVIRMLIDHNKRLFTVPAELLDEVYIHMMDSHPEALDELLTKKDAGVYAEESLDDLDSESNSAPWTAAPTNDSDNLVQNTIDSEFIPQEPRRTYSREEFLHESAAMGGPNVAMRVRHKDRFRERSKKKHDEQSNRRPKDETNPSMSLMYKMHGQRDEDNIFGKMRSASIESNSYNDNDINRRIKEDNANIDRRKSTPYLMGNSGVITASLTIPVPPNQALSLNVDDDIPYIEDGSGYIYNNDGKQQMTIGLIKNCPVVPPRRRQRSMSGSDSSVASNIQPVTGTISLGQGYDSAMGSSATFSSPPHNTTPSSINSSMADPGAYSSPPSWASTPPTSPDSQSTSVNYIPDDIPTSKPVKTLPTQKTSKDSPILQKVTFTSTTEMQQKTRTTEVKTYQKETTYQRISDIQKSQSSPTFSNDKNQEHSKFSPSITSIGNAVLRSRTADFERISKPEKPSPKTTTSSDKKKYTKRRYTDSRHQTRHIPDAESLEASSSQSGKNDRNTTVTQIGPVYKRRELISSVPSK